MGHAETVQHLAHNVDMPSDELVALLEKRKKDAAHAWCTGHCGVHCTSHK